MSRYFIDLFIYNHINNLTNNHKSPFFFLDLKYNKYG